ncbi:hypothetical protein FUA48_08505 [Flavobacterium alkalisoli]|uniref:Uncharacterized protein n=1 Tax=Flavobacterium alkalisoli TaxID=2602769 RepID=A0A5B9FTR5_9FLAO|nr:hypothetical protein [Flavobacterium alkalisoli]QEE49621.1 hypothetical protein FUA48_08505 [Flavobacterium alkalisoli]
MPIFDKHTARIKLVILTKPGEKNITWYSLEKEKNKPEKSIIDGMIKRFERSSYTKIAQVLQFYDNKSNQLIAVLKG